jgi:hypothetical protein
VQVWAVWFPLEGKPQSFIQGFPQQELSLSPAGTRPFHLAVRDNRIGEDFCAGHLEVGSHRISWDLRYRSTFAITVTNWGWIGFSRTPHSDAVFSGTIRFDDRLFQGEPLATGLQGHNCGFRHRHLWNWAHCLLPAPGGNGFTAFEALDYELPLGFRHRKAVLWHRGRLRLYRRMEQLLRDRNALEWMVSCSGAADGSRLVAFIDGRGPGVHRLSYLKTDCSGTFEVANNSLARATLYFSRPGQALEHLHTEKGAVVEMVGGPEIAP